MLGVWTVQSREPKKLFAGLGVPMKSFVHHRLNHGIQENILVLLPRPVAATSKKNASLNFLEMENDCSLSFLAALGLPLGFPDW